MENGFYRKKRSLELNPALNKREISSSAQKLDSKNTFVRNYLAQQGSNVVAKNIVRVQAMPPHRRPRLVNYGHEVGKLQQKISNSSVKDSYSTERQSRNGFKSRSLCSFSKNRACPHHKTIKKVTLFGKTRDREAEKQFPVVELANRSDGRTRNSITCSTGSVNLKSQAEQKSLETKESIVWAQRNSRKLESYENDSAGKKDRLGLTGKKFVGQNPLKNHFAFGCVEQQFGVKDKISPVKARVIRTESKQSDEESAHLFCSGKYTESVMSLEESLHPSPVSVLEPDLEEDNPRRFDFLDEANLQGLEHQLEHSVSESSEIYSDGYEMIVSSDDETDHESSQNLEEAKNENLITFLKNEEYMAFSYMTDVLTETNSLQTHGVLNPVNPTIFEKLEKKYANQTWWQKSERRFFFDRVNKGLKEIMKSPIGIPMWTQPVSRRFKFGQGRTFTDEELWLLLVTQEKQTKKGGAVELLKNDGWLELGKDIEFIVKEIESFLIDQLVAEVLE